MEYQTPHVHVAIIGTGFGGLGAAIRLKQDGEQDFVILERASEIGGTWRDNSYPGCACDVQSHLYSFSFDLNPNWSRSYSPQPEIWQYLKDCVQRHGLGPHLRLGREVKEARWDDARRRWSIETSRETFTADVLISAAGALSDPSIPELHGLGAFEGEVFHSATWNHRYDLRGKRVAVIGTGASAIQFVPRIQKEVARLTLFQRTPPWVMPRRDHAIGALVRSLYRRVPLAQRAMRGAIYGARELMVLGFMHPWVMKGVEIAARRHLERSVHDPALRRKLLPSYRIGCKRILLSDDYYPSLQQPNVDVVTAGIRTVTATGVVDQDGVHHDVDALIFATGFHVTDPPIARHVRGRDGRTLHEAWGGSPKAHLGTMVHGFPNLFLLLGPNTALGHSSVVFMIESQVEVMRAAVRHLRETRAGAIEPRRAAQDAFLADVDHRLEGTVWNAGGCASWYLDATGRNSTIWPGFTFDYRRRAVAFDPSEYHLHGPSDGAVSSPRDARRLQPEVSSAS